MAKARVKLDHGGISRVLRSREMTSAVHVAAEDIAARVKASATVKRHAVTVEVDDYVTDRAASSVTIAHPAGLAMQAKYGVLTKAARGTGINVKAKR